MIGGSFRSPPGPRVVDRDILLLPGFAEADFGQRVLHVVDPEDAQQGGAREGGAFVRRASNECPASLPPSRHVLGAGVGVPETLEF